MVSYNFTMQARSQDLAGGGGGGGGGCVCAPPARNVEGRGRELVGGSGGYSPRKF